MNFSISFQITFHLRCVYNRVLWCFNENDREDYLFIFANNKSIDRCFPHVMRSLANTIEPSLNSKGISSQLDIFLDIGKGNENFPTAIATDAAIYRSFVINLNRPSYLNRVEGKDIGKVNQCMDAFRILLYLQNSFWPR